MPRHQGGVVVGTEIVHVLHNETILGGFGNLGQAGNFSVGENVFVHPGIRRALAKIAANGMQQQQAIFCQIALRHLEKFVVILAADMLEHADTGDAVECALKTPVIHQAECDRQSLAAFCAISGLLAGDGYACA